MNDDLRSAIAEFIGTFTLVFIGAGAGALAGINGGGILAVAVAHGVALMVIIYAWGAVSGAHVNPAVTFGLALAGKIDWIKTLFYWIAQFTGAALAAYLLAYLIGIPSGLGATTGSLTNTDALKTVIVEAVLTFFLVVAVFGTAVSQRNGNAAGFAIGFVLLMDILMGGALTGASMNPARTFGPALATGDLSYFWMYIAGPLLGAAVAALFYDWAFTEPKGIEGPADATRSETFQEDR
jgi:MIP family channel proteins